jgi:hypothetical protein
MFRSCTPGLMQHFAHLLRHHQIVFLQYLRAQKALAMAESLPSLKSALPEGYASVSTASLVPAELADVRSGDEFVQKLPQLDDQFE